MERLKVGFVAGFMSGFSTEGLKLFEENKKELANKAKDMDFDFISFDTIISSIAQAIEIRKALDSNNIDFAFFPSLIYSRRFYFEIMKSRSFWTLGNRGTKR